MASKNEDKVIKEPFFTRFMAFLRRFRIVLLSILGAIVVAAIVLIIVFSVKASKEKKLYRAFVPIESKYNEVLSSENKDYTEVLGELNGFINNSSSYPVIASLLMRANIYISMGEFENAYNDYEAIYNRTGKNNYYNEIALHGMAATKEESGERDTAKGYYEKLWSDYGEASSYASRSLFALLRFAIEDGDKTKEVEYRDILADDFAFTDYGRYARSLRDKEEAASSENADSSETLSTAENSDTSDTNSASN